jgi:hypothetical protein
MNKNLTVTIDDDIYEKFRIALSLTKDEQNQAIEHCMKWYITKSFEKAAQAYSQTAQSKPDEDAAAYFHGKANQRIPSWAFKPTQYNHKIIRAFFKAEKATGRVTITDLELLCNDKSVPELYVPTFRSNYAQMKLDAPKSHGKVFEDDGETVTIWGEVKDTLLKHKKFFCD